MSDETAVKSETTAPGRKLTFDWLNRRVHLYLALALLPWFLVYGVYYGFSEGVEKALVADLAPAAMRGTAFGLYNAVLGVGALAASLVFGYVWNVAGAPSAFAMGASLALAATVLLFLVVAARPAEPGSSARS